MSDDSTTRIPAAIGQLGGQVTQLRGDVIGRTDGLRGNGHAKRI